METTTGKEEIKAERTQIAQLQILDLPLAICHNLNMLYFMNCKYIKLQVQKPILYLLNW